MKPIRIHPDNQAAIEAALADVNGRANAHTYSIYVEIQSLAEDGEAQLESLQIPVKHRTGAAWSETSGGKVPNAYAKLGRYRVATSVRIERRSTGWFLVSLASVDIGQQGGGAGRLTLTQAQADIATEKFRSQFSIQRPPFPMAA